MSRQKKSLLNANINIIFYFVSAVLAFFSRKIFLQYLGDDFMGLTGTIGNMLGLMNMAELGIGTAVGVSLYKPIFDNDRQKINEIISVFGFLWRRVGQFILLVAVVVSLFFPLFFEDTLISFPVIYVLFFSYLVSALIGYFNNYRQILLSADQRNYVITYLFNSIVVVKTISQMVLLVYTQNYYIWILLELLFNVLYTFILNYKINKTYPWLKSNVKEGKHKLKEYKFLLSKTKDVFAHKISNLIKNQTDQILIFSFTSLATVAQYGNYMLLINKLGSLLDVMFSGLNAGIGNLINENDKFRVKEIFWELNSFKFYSGGVLVIILYYLIEPVISLWVGKQYIMEKPILLLMLANLYFSQISSTTELFKSAYGLFQDIGAPIVEVFINLCLALVLGAFFGIEGVLIGAASSSLVIKVVWKPYYLYKNGFKESIIEYWGIVAKYLAGLVISIVIMHYLAIFIDQSNNNSITGFLIYALCISVPSSLLYAIYMCVADSGFRNFVLRMWRLLPVIKK